MAKKTGKLENPGDKIVTARILFTGLMLMCINKKKQFEVGFIRCADHEPKMRIEIMPEGGHLITLNTRITGDLYIRAVNSTTSKVTPNMDNKDWSFKLQPDVEGDKFHNKKLTVNTSVLAARVSVNAGELYVHQTKPYEYDITKWRKPSDLGECHKQYGKLPDFTGLNIQCKTLGGVAIFDRVTGEKTWLPATPGTRYTITINNDCYHPYQVPKGSDFRLYYISDLVTTEDPGRADSIKYDFQRRGAERSPEICEGMYLKKTKTLGLPTPTYQELDVRAESVREESKRRKGRR